MSDYKAICKQREFKCFIVNAVMLGKLKLYLQVIFDCKFRYKAIKIFG